MSITLNSDEEVVKKIRKIAIDKDTTLTALVRDYLTWLTEGDAPERSQRVTLLENSFHSVSRNMGRRNWKRDDLYAR